MMFRTIGETPIEQAGNQTNRHDQIHTHTYTQNMHRYVRTYIRTHTVDSFIGSLELTSNSENQLIATRVRGSPHHVSSRDTQSSFNRTPAKRTYRMRRDNIFIAAVAPLRAAPSRARTRRSQIVFDSHEYSYLQVGDNGAISGRTYSY